MPRLRPQTIRGFHALLAAATSSWDRKDQPESLRRYVLAYGATHLRATGDHERLWQLLQSEEYRRAQLDAFQQYEAAYRALREGIDLYVERQGQAPEDDPRLCWLALRAGELGNEAKGDIAVAFEWARSRPLDDDSRLDDALQRLSVLDTEGYYKAVLLLLWIEAEQQAELPRAAQTDRGVHQLVDALDERIAVMREGIDWSRFVPLEFMTWFASWVVIKLPPSAIDGAASLLSHTTGLQEFSEQLIQLLGTQPELVTQRQIRLILALESWLDAPTARANIRAALAALLIRSGMKEEARTLLEDALRLAEGGDASACDSDTWTRIAGSLKAIGERPAARVAYTKAIERLAQETDANEGWLRTAVAMTREGEVALALDAVARLSAEAARRDILSAVLEALPAAEEIEAVDEVTQRLLTCSLAFSDPFSQQSVLSATAAALVRIGRVGEAETLIPAVTTWWGLLNVGERLADCGQGEVAARVFEAALLSFGNEDALPGLDERLLPRGSRISYTRMIQLQRWLDVIREAGDLPGRQRLLHAAMAAAEAIERQYFRSRTLSYLAIALVDMNDPQLALTAAREALDAAKASDDPLEKADAVSGATRALAYAGALELALDTIATDLPHETRLSAIMGIVREVSSRAETSAPGEFIEHASYWVETSRDPMSRSVVLCGIAQVVARLHRTADVHGLYDRAVTLASSIDSEDVRASTLAQIGSEIAGATYIPDRTTLWELILGRTRQVGDATYRSSALTRLAGALTAAGRFERAIDLAVQESDSATKTTIVLSILHEASEMRTSRPGATRDILQRLVDSAEQLAEPSEQPFFLDYVAHWLQEVPSESEIHRKREFDALADSLRSGDHAEAFQILARSIRRVGENPEGYGRSGWLSDLASILIDSSDFDAALGIAEDRTLGGGWSAGIVAQLARVVRRAGAAGDWMPLLPRMIAITEALRNYPKDQHYGFPNDHRDQAIRAIISALSELGRIDDALARAQTLPEQVRTSALLDIARASLNSRSEHAEAIIEQADALASEIADSSRTKALQDLVELLAEAGHGARAGRMLERALDAAESMEARSDRERALNALACLALRSRGIPDRSRLVARAVQLLDGAAVRDVADALAAADDLPNRGGLALDLTRSFEAEHDRTQRRPSDAALRAIARVLLEVGRLDDLMAAIGSSVHRTYRAHALLAVAGVLGEAGLHQSAHQTIQAAREIALGQMDGSDGIVDRGSFRPERSWFFSHSVKLLLELGELDAANSEVRFIENPANRSATLTSIAVALARAGRVLDACVALRAALASAHAIKHLATKLRRLREITDCVGDLDNVPGQKDLLREVLTSAAAVTSVADMPEFHLNVAKSLVRARALTDASYEFRRALSLASSTTNESVLGLIHEAVSAATDLPGREDILECALEAVVTARGIHHNDDVRRLVARAFTPAQFSRYAQSLHMTESDWLSLLHYRRRFLVEESSTPLSALRETFRYCTFSAEAAYDAVRALHLAQLKAGRRGVFDAITQHCIQLGISFRLHAGAMK